MHWPFGYHYHHIPESVSFFFFFGVFLWGLSILDAIPFLVPVAVGFITVWNVAIAFYPKFAEKVLRILHIFQEKKYVPDPIGAKISTVLLLLASLGLGYFVGMHLF